MSFGKLKTALRGLINRKDFTDQLAGDFINRAIDEVERVCRLGSMSALLENNDWDGVQNAISIPQGYLETIDLFTEAGTLTQVTKDQFFRDRSIGAPAVYIKAGRSFLVKPAPAPGTVLWLEFYQETPVLTADTDENVWTRSGFDAVLYAAAAMAADYFQMEDVYVQRFQGKSDNYVGTIQSQANEETWAAQMSVGRVTGAGEY